MVAGFSRSFSLPGSPRLLKASRPPSENPRHVRSISLPCRSHPLLSQLEDDIRSVDSWRLLLPHPSPQPESASWICDGLARLEILHSSLADLLSLPPNQDCLRRCGSGSDLADRILDDFLRFADVHGSFRTELLSVNELQSEAQVSVRRNDLVQLASCARSMKNTEKQLLKLVSLTNREASRSLSSSSSVATRFTKGIEEAELAGIIREVINVTASASAAVFLETAAILSSNCTELAALLSTTKKTWMAVKRLSPSRSSSRNIINIVGGGQGKDCRRNVMERLEGLEECFGAVEKRSERMFRCLVNTRVSLLNILSSH